MNQILNCFDAAFLINIDQHSSRLENSLIELNRVGIECERFSGVIPEKSAGKCSVAELGCSLSHYQAIKSAKERGFKNVLIFEDDIVFRSDFLQRWEKIADDVRQINYDLFYFYDWENYNQNGNHPNLIPISGTLCTHAYAANSNFFDPLLKAIMTQMNNRAVDRIFQSIPGKKWAVLPNLIGQAGGRSMVDGSYKNLRWSSRDG